MASGKHTFKQVPITAFIGNYTMPYHPPRDALMICVGYDTCMTDSTVTPLDVAILGDYIYVVAS
jgi:hypothetical protein